MLGDLKSYLIKQQSALFKAGAVYDIFNPDNDKQVGQAKEVVSGMSFLLKMLFKGAAPKRVDVTEHSSNNLVFSIQKPFAFFRSSVNVHNAEGKRLGYFQSKILSIGGGFWVYDDKDQQIAEIKGKWTGREFKFNTPDGKELGSVGKPVGGVSGLAKAIFLGADTYQVNFTDSVKDADTRTLLLAAPLAIDVVYHER